MLPANHQANTAPQSWPTTATRSTPVLSLLGSVATGVALAVAVVPGGVEATGVVMGWCRGLLLYLVRYRDLGSGEQRGQGDRVAIALVSPRRPGHLLNTSGVIVHRVAPRSVK